MTNRERNQAAMAVVEIEDFRDQLSHAAEKAALEKRVADQRRVFNELLDSANAQIDNVVRRLGEEASVPSGVPVGMAALYLDISEPTIRKWLKRGALKTVAGSKPVLVERESMRSVKQAIEDLRSKGQDKAWLDELTDYLYDRSERRSAEVARGISEMEHGKLEPA